MSRSFRALALALAVVGLTAGCGGHKDVTPTAFAPAPTNRPQGIGGPGGTGGGPGKTAPPLSP